MRDLETLKEKYLLINELDLVNELTTLVIWTNYKDNPTETMANVLEEIAEIEIDEKILVEAQEYEIAIIAKSERLMFGKIYKEMLKMSN